MTAPTPMMMPSIVSAVRSLLRFIARTATLSIASRFIVLVLAFFWKLVQHFPGVSSTLNRKVPSYSAIAELNNSIRVLGNVRFVRDQNDRQIAIPVQSLKNLHHFDGRARVERSRRFICQYQRRVVHQR